MRVHDRLAVTPRPDPGGGQRTTSRWIALAITIAWTFAPTIAARAETWNIQRGRSDVSFSVKHAIFLQVIGEFKEFSGTVECPEGDFSRGRIDVSIDVGSIYTGHPDRDLHLRQEEFFFEDRFPEIRYFSRAVEHVGGNRYEITGDLTIRGVTREVKLDAELTSRRSTPKGDRADFLATGKLNRYDFGLRWNDLVETGGMLVAEEVQLKLDVALLATE